MSLAYNDLNRYYQQKSLGIVETDEISAIEMDISNILECPVRSFMFNRGFGARLRSFLFEPINEETAAAIRIYLIEAISQWEPRVYVNMKDSYVRPDYDQNTYYVRLVYVIRKSGIVQEFIRTMATQVGN